MKTTLWVLSLLACTALGVGAAIYLVGMIERPIEDARQMASTTSPTQAASTASKPEPALAAPTAQQTAAVEAAAVSETLAPEATPPRLETPPIVARRKIVVEELPVPAQPETRTKAAFVAAVAPTTTGATDGLDLSGAMKALQNADPGTQKQLQEMGQKLLQDPNAIKGMLNGTGLENIINDKTLDNIKTLGGAPQIPPELQLPAPREEVPTPVGPPRPPLHQRPVITRSPNGEGDDNLTINMQDEDLREVLELLSEQGNLNILASDSVQGRVSAVLKNVSVYGALDAILKSTGYVMHRQGQFIYVGTPKDFAQLQVSLDKLGTRVYRPNYVTAKELQLLLTPLLTQGTGRISVTTPAAVGIAIDTNSAGGDSYAHGEGVLVQDYEAVLAQVDEVVREIDRRPLQVHIDAMIIAVTLNDNTKIGVDFQWLRNEQNVRFGSGTPRVNPLNGAGRVDPATGGTVGEYQFTNGGLQFAFLDQSLGMFLTMLETVGDINVLSTPRLLCLNKQRAEILIGSQIPYTTSTVTQTFTTQTVQFLDIGTQLRLRPYISSDGSIRMEVHPEISSAGPLFNGVPSKNLTQVTTDVMCYDGCTIIIGGLMQEDLSTTISQVPYLGSLPYVGPLFRTKTDNTVRREILVLLTPRIVYEPEYPESSAEQKEEFERRQLVAEDSQSLISRVVSARRFIRRSQEAREKGDFVKARRFANLAVRFDPNSRAAIQQRDELNAMLPSMQSAINLGYPQSQAGAVRVVPEAPVGAHGAVVEGDELSPMVLDDLEGAPVAPTPVHPIRPGVPGMIHEIPMLELFNHDPLHP